jgi:hypothetical protein
MGHAWPASLAFLRLFRLVSDACYGRLPTERPALLLAVDPEEVAPVSSLSPCLTGAVRLETASQGSALSRKAVWLAGLAALALALLALPVVASAATCTDSRTGPAEGPWGTAADWSAEHVPTSSDVACIGSGFTVEASSGSNQAGVVQGEGSLVISGGTLEVTNSLEQSVISGLVLSASGVLAGAGTVKVSGSLLWKESSTMSGTGSTILPSGATGLMEVSNIHDVMRLSSGRAFVNEGTLTFASGTLYMLEGTALENRGTLKQNTETLLQTCQVCAKKKLKPPA